ncbi:MAG: c-type cytochrome [Oscillochloris sp.]|nr:c-type cytochrome [Oscillochloris sp.]
MPTVAPAAHGRALFINKGCITCHAHRNLHYRGTTIGIGPDLTDYRADEAFLRQWLRDPASVRPATTMPNLGLSENEIGALIAFLQ